MDTFTYLVSTVTDDAVMDQEIEYHSGSSTFGSFYNYLWNTNDISLKIKVNIYKFVVFTSLLNGTESWTLYHKNTNELDMFPINFLRQKSDIMWNDKIRNSDILRNYNISGMEIFLIKIQLMWVGQLIQMEDKRLPKQLFFGQIRTVPILWFILFYSIKISIKITSSDAILILRHGINWQKADMNGTKIVSKN